MSDRNAYLLVRRLYEQARDGKLEWTATSRPRSYATRIGRYTINISELDDPEYPDAPDYAVSLYNDEHHWIETITNTSLRAYAEERVDDLNPYMLMQTTYRRAHRIALRVDESIAEVLRELDRD